MLSYRIRISRKCTTRTLSRKIGCDSPSNLRLADITMLVLVIEVKNQDLRCISTVWECKAWNRNWYRVMNELGLEQNHLNISVEVLETRPFPCRVGRQAFGLFAWYMDSLHGHQFDLFSLASGEGDNYGRFSCEAPHGWFSRTWNNRLLAAFCVILSNDFFQSAWRTRDMN